MTIMQTSTIRRDDSLVLSVTGRLDAVTAPELERDFPAAAARRLILDLSGLEYISSAGLRIILALVKGQKASGGSLSVCGLSGLVGEVFAVSGFDSFLPIYPDVEAALAASA
jgi:anti-anti-sigma factor